MTAWLRAQGVEGDRPLHTLRKEFGSIICAAADIHTSQPPVAALEPGYDGRFLCGSPEARDRAGHGHAPTQ